MTVAKPAPDATGADATTRRAPSSDSDAVSPKRSPLLMPPGSTSGPKAVSPLVHSNKPSRCGFGGVVLVDGRHRHARAVQGQRNVVSHMSAHVADESPPTGTQSSELLS